MKFKNTTPFEAGRYVIQDSNGKDILVIVVKATFHFDHSDSVKTAEEQYLIEPADSYYGDPETTGIKYASDVTFGKKATDIALVGHAVAPKEKAVKSLVKFSVGKISKTVAVFGDRYWKGTLDIGRISSPMPFYKIPLTYENAFGGKDVSPKNEKHHDYEKRNPIGTGLMAKKSQLQQKEIKLPNLEDPKNLIKSPTDRPIPTSFGYISPYWEPRLGYAGTYDEKWQKNRMPFLPDDFDTKYNHAAHPDLIYPGFIKGNESIVIAGVSEKGIYKFNLPYIKPVVTIEFTGSENQHPEMTVEKLIVNTDDQKAALVWSVILDIHNRLHDIESIETKLAEIEHIKSKI